MTRSILKSFGGVFLAGVLAMPVWADRNPPGQGPQGPPQPGTVNYVEGQATLGGQPLDRNTPAGAAMQPGQMLSTQNGRAEILLTQGVFFRLGNNSSAEMVSPDIVNTEIRLSKGRALVEVDWVQKESRLRVDVGGVPVELQEKGLYDFDADHNQVRVFDGRAAVLQGTREVHVQGGHEMVLNADKLKAQGFDKNAYQDDLYRWSKLRSSYIAEANVEMAHTYNGGGQGYYGAPYGGNYGYGYAAVPWYGTGWYWDPWFSAYTWLPGDGIFWNPWGFGFYSPLFAYRAPFIGGLYASRNFGAGFRPAIAPGGLAVSHAAFNARAGAAPAARGFSSSGGVHGGGGFASGGGFHGGGGGFHGGGGGGRR